MPLVQTLVDLVPEGAVRITRLEDAHTARRIARQEYPGVTFTVHNYGAQPVSFWDELITELVDVDWQTAISLKTLFFSVGADIVKTQTLLGIARHMGYAPNRVDWFRLPARSLFLVDDEWYKIDERTRTGLRDRFLSSICFHTMAGENPPDIFESIPRWTFGPREDVRAG